MSAAAIGVSALAKVGENGPRPQSYLFRADWMCRLKLRIGAEVELGVESLTRIPLVHVYSTLGSSIQDATWGCFN